MTEAQRAALAVEAAIANLIVKFEGRLYPEEVKLLQSAKKVATRISEGR
jgi:hypothetical protein